METKEIKIGQIYTKILDNETKEEGCFIVIDIHELRKYNTIYTMWDDASAGISPIVTEHIEDGTYKLLAEYETAEEAILSKEFKKFTNNYENIHASVYDAPCMFGLYGLDVYLMNAKEWGKHVD